VTRLLSTSAPQTGITVVQTPGGLTWPDLKRVKYFNEFRMAIGTPEQGGTEALFATRDGIEWFQLTNPDNTLYDTYDLTWAAAHNRIVTAGSATTRNIGRSPVIEPVACGADESDSLFQCSPTVVGGTCRGTRCAAAQAVALNVSCAGTIYNASSWTSALLSGTSSSIPRLFSFKELGRIFIRRAAEVWIVRYTGSTDTPAFDVVTQLNASVLTGDGGLAYLRHLGLMCATTTGDNLVCVALSTLWHAETDAIKTTSTTIRLVVNTTFGSLTMRDIAYSPSLNLTVVATASGRFILTRDLVTFILAPKTYTGYDFRRVVWSPISRIFIACPVLTAGLFCHASVDGWHWIPMIRGDLVATETIVCADEDMADFVAYACYVNSNLRLAGLPKPGAGNNIYAFTYINYPGTEPDFFPLTIDHRISHALVYVDGGNLLRVARNDNGDTFPTNPPSALTDNPYTNKHTAVFDFRTSHVLILRRYRVWSSPVCSSALWTCPRDVVGSDVPSATCPGGQFRCTSHSTCDMATGTTYCYLNWQTPPSGSATARTVIGAYNTRDKHAFWDAIRVTRDISQLYQTGGTNTLSYPSVAGNTRRTTPSFDALSGAIFVDVSESTTLVSLPTSSPRTFQNVTWNSGLKHGHAAVVCSEAFGTCVTGRANVKDNRDAEDLTYSTNGYLTFSLDRAAWFTQESLQTTVPAIGPANTSTASVRLFSVAYSPYLKRYATIARIGSNLHFGHSDDGGRNWILTGTYSTSVFFTDDGGAEVFPSEVVWNEKWLEFFTVLGKHLMKSATGIEWQAVIEYGTLVNAPLRGHAYLVQWLSEVSAYVFAPNGRNGGTNIGSVYTMHPDLFGSITTTSALLATAPSVDAMTWSPDQYAMVAYAGGTIYRASSCQAAHACWTTGSTPSTQSICQIDVVMQRARYDAASLPSDLWSVSKRMVTATCWTGTSSADPITTCGHAFGVPTPCSAGRVFRNARTEYVSFNSSDNWLCTGVTASGPTNSSCTPSLCPTTAYTNRTTTTAALTEVNVHTHYQKSCTRKYEQIPCTATCVAPSPSTLRSCSVQTNIGRWGTFFVVECITGASATPLTGCGSIFSSSGANLTCTAGQRTQKRVYLQSVALDVHSECAGAATASATNGTCTGPAGYDAGTLNETRVEITPVSVPFTTFIDSAPTYCKRTYSILPCTTSAPINCTVSAWSSFSACSHDCFGYSYRTRTVTTEPLNGGAECPVLIEFVTCNTNKAQCTTTATLAAAVSSPAPVGGSQCHERSNLVSLNSSTALFKRVLVACTAVSSPTIPLLTDCGLREGPTFLTTCPTGSTNYTVSIAAAVANYSQTCTDANGASNTTGTCNQTTCVWYNQRLDHWYTRETTAGWTYPTQCTHTRALIACNNTDPCDCQVSGWGAFGACSVSCGGGVRNRTRTVTNPGFNGGAACPSLVDSEACNTQCCAVNCTLGAWGNFGACNATCGGGYQTRTRPVIQSESCGGVCDATSETQACNTHPCPEDCQVGEWSNFTECSRECGNGTQSRTRNVTQEPLHGGEECPDLIEFQACNEDPCSVECDVVEGAWGPCTPSCGARTQTRTVFVLAGDPEVCGVTHDETRACDPVACPIDCVMSNWTEWSTCTVACGGGTQFRNRTILTPAQNGGTACGPTGEVRDCNAQSCGVNCEYSDWSAYGTCTASCGGGVRVRTRNITVPSIPPGIACTEALVEVATCNTSPCPVDCIMGEWATNGVCVNATNTSAYCGVGNGVLIYTRSVVQPAANGGEACGNTTRTEVCTLVPCVASLAAPGDTGCFPSCGLDSSSGEESSSSSSSSVPEEESSSSSGPDIIDQPSGETVVDEAAEKLPTWAYIVIGCGAVAAFAVITGTWYGVRKFMAKRAFGKASSSSATDSVVTTGSYPLHHKPMKQQMRW